MPAYAFKTEGFQGPLEVLLDLIESRKMSVSAISLAEVCDAYLSYLESLQELPLKETSQFVVVASTLLLIKSRSLLPNLSLTEEEKESVIDLERRLKQLALARRAAKSLSVIWGTRPLQFPKRVPPKKAIFSPAESSIGRIVTAAKRLVATIPKPEIRDEARVAPVVRLDDVIASLRKRIQFALKAQWSELIKGAKRDETIVYFLAMLELVRSGSASVTQERLFSDITIESEGIHAPRYG